MVAMAANDMVKCLGGIVAGTARSVAAAKEKIRQPGLDCVMLDVNLNGDLSFGIARISQTRKFAIARAPLGKASPSPKSLGISAFIWLTSYCLAHHRRNPHSCEAPRRGNRGEEAGGARTVEQDR